MKGTYLKREELTDRNKDQAEYIDHDIFFIKKEKKTKFGNIVSSPKLIEFCKYTNIEFRYDTLTIENIMRYSTQVPAITKYIINKPIFYDFKHTKLEVKNNNIFNLNQMEYNIWYCLDIYYSCGPESNPYGLFIFLDIKKRLSPLGFRFRDTDIKVNIELILYLSSQKVKERWNSLFEIDSNEFEKMSDESKMAYYLYWTDKKDFIYEKMNNRSYNDLVEEVTKDEISFMRRILFK